MTKLKLKTEKRKLFGRKIKKLRQEGILPANVYGKGIKSQALKVDLKEFLTVYKEAGETGIIELGLAKEKKSRQVLIHNLQKHPVTDQLLHADFHQIDLKQKVQINIPIELKGEPPAVSKGGVLVQLMSEIEIEALPTELPGKFEIDISKIEEIGQSITVKDLKVDKKKVKILVDDEDQLIAKVEQQKEEKEEEKPVEETPAEGEEAKEGEEAPAEGEKKEEAKEGEEKKPAEGQKPAETKKPTGNKPEEKKK